MPGYMLHLAEATIIIKEWEKRGFHPDKEWVNQFMLGCLLPDTKLRMEKITSHFWDPATVNRQAIPPDLDRFLEKYGDYMDQPLMKGYYAHLHLDRQYVTKFWKKHFRFYNAEGEEVALKKDVHTVKILRNGELVPAATFFSADYYYGDYTRMNSWILDHYGFESPKYVEGLACPVEEVNYDDVKNILRELEHLRETVKRGTEKNLKVFTLEDMDAFICTVGAMGTEVSHMGTEVSPQGTEVSHMRTEVSPQGTEVIHES